MTDHEGRVSEADKILHEIIKTIPAQIASVSNKYERLQRELHETEMEFHSRLNEVNTEFATRVHTIEEEFRRCRQRSEILEEVVANKEADKSRFLGDAASFFKIIAAIIAIVGAVVSVTQVQSCMTRPVNTSVEDKTDG